MSQFIRLVFEQIECVMRYKDENGKDCVSLQSLRGRTVFERNTTHNIVGHAELGFDIDLAALRDDNPNIVEWAPDDFPAAKAKVWLTEDLICHCGFTQDDTATTLALPKDIRRMVKKKCVCSIKCLIYENGHIVEIGGRQVRDVNWVFYHMKDLMRYYEYGHVNLKRKKSEKLAFFIPFQPNVGKIREPKTLTTSEAIAKAIMEAHSYPTTRQQTRHTNIPTTIAISPLVRMALMGALRLIQQTLEFEPDCDADVKEAIEQLSRMRDRTAQQDAVLSFLIQQQTTL